MRKYWATLVAALGLAVLAGWRFFFFGLIATLADPAATRADARLHRNIWLIVFAAAFFLGVFCVVQLVRHRRSQRLHETHAA